MGLGMLSWKFKWENITYTTPELDVQDIQLKLVRSYDKPQIKFDFPAVKLWEIHAIQHTNTWLTPSVSPVKLVVKDLDLDLEADFQLSGEGYLDPVVYNCKLNFGDSYLYHDNSFVAFFMHQYIYYTLIVIENSVYFVGQYIFTHMLGPVLDEMMNHYRTNIRLPSPLLGQTSSDIFSFDFRSVRSPNIQEGYVDLFILGELIHNNYECVLEADDMGFVNNNVFSQLVVSESAATCIANSMARSRIGRVYLTEDKINKLFQEHDFKFTTTSMKKHLPIFEQRLGKNRPMKWELDFKDIKVMFGQYDSDIIIDYTLLVRFTLDQSDSLELFYDEVNMVTSMNMEATNDVLFIDI